MLLPLAQELEPAHSYHIHLRGTQLDPHCPGSWACSHYPSLMVIFSLEQHPRASPVKDSLGIGASGSSSVPKGPSPDSLDVDATSGWFPAPFSWLENTGEPPEYPSGPARDEQPGMSSPGLTQQGMAAFPLSTIAPQVKHFHVFLHSRLPHRTRASCRFLLSQHQMTKKTEGKHEQGKRLSVFSCAACC